MEKVLMSRVGLFEEIVDFIREEFNTNGGVIPLHEPRFTGNERQYVMDAIDSTFVSSVGAYVDRFENMMTEITGANFAIALVNGTSALHVALLLADVNRGDEVITQPLTFVATANAINYAGAFPLFIDVDKDSLGLSPEKLTHFIKHNLVRINGNWINRQTSRKVKACVPMHTFGLPLRIDEIVKICEAYEIPVVEDSAESLGSFFQGQSTGTFGRMGIFSFNGNKTVTSGGGGAVVTNDESLAKRAKHITTTAKKSHRWEYRHDEVGFNYRMPNLNAALACAQLEMLDEHIEHKRKLAKKYADFFESRDIQFVKELPEAKSNYWLNTILFSNRQERDRFLEYTNDNKVMTRPAWQLLNTLPTYENAYAENLSNAEWLEDRIVNVPSSPGVQV